MCGMSSISLQEVIEVHFYFIQVIIKYVWNCTLSAIRQQYIELQLWMRFKVKSIANRDSLQFILAFAYTTVIITKRWDAKRMQ